MSLSWTHRHLLGCLSLRWSRLLPAGGPLLGIILCAARLAALALPAPPHRRVRRVVRGDNRLQTRVACQWRPCDSMNGVRTT